MCATSTCTLKSASTLIPPLNKPVSMPTRISTRTCSKIVPSRYPKWIIDCALLLITAVAVRSTSVCPPSLNGSSTRAGTRPPTGCGQDPEASTLNPVRGSILPGTASVTERCHSLVREWVNGRQVAQPSGHRFLRKGVSGNFS